MASSAAPPSGSSSAPTTRFVTNSQLGPFYAKTFPDVLLNGTRRANIVTWRKASKDPSNVWASASWIPVTRDTPLSASEEFECGKESSEKRNKCILLNHFPV